MWRRRLGIKSQASKSERHDSIPVAFQVQLLSCCSEISLHTCIHKSNYILVQLYLENYMSQFLSALAGPISILHIGMMNAAQTQTQSSRSFEDAASEVVCA